MKASQAFGLIAAVMTSSVVVTSTHAQARGPLQAPIPKTADIEPESSPEFRFSEDLLSLSYISEPRESGADPDLNDRGAAFDSAETPLSLSDIGDSPGGPPQATDSEQEEAESASDPESEPSHKSLTELANKLSNPVGDLWVVQTQYNVNQIHGQPFDGSKWQNNMNVQPVLPLHLTDEWNLINRPIIPLYFGSPYPELDFDAKKALPRLLTKDLLSHARRLDRVLGGRSRGLMGGALKGHRLGRTGGGLSGGMDIETDRACGIGDITFLSLLSPRKPPKMGAGHFIWGAGPTFIFPTASPGVLGQGQYQAGPAFVGMYMDKKWVVGALAQQWWSYAEKGSGHEHTNQLSLQYFCWYQFLPGWQVGSAPIASVDWTRPCSEGFTLPVGLGIQHVFKVGRMPLKVAFEYEYAVVHPDHDAGLGSIFRITVSPVLPALIERNILQ